MPMASAGDASRARIAAVTKGLSPNEARARASRVCEALTVMAPK
jgi:hypothetical protein